MSYHNLKYDNQKHNYLQLCSHFPLKKRDKNGYYFHHIENQRSNSCIKKWKTLTGFPVLLVLSVESVHSLQQLPLLAAAGVIDKVPGENLFQLADGEVLYRGFVVQIGQWRPDPPLCRRADLQFTTWKGARVTKWAATALLLLVSRLILTLFSSVNM